MCFYFGLIKMCYGVYCVRVCINGCGFMDLWVYVFLINDTLWANMKPNVVTQLLSKEYSAFHVHLQS